LGAMTELPEPARSHRPVCRVADRWFNIEINETQTQSGVSVEYMIMYLSILSSRLSRNK
jgi:hypothetical protein